MTDYREGIAQVRRLYHHALKGGEISHRDMARVLETMENMDARRAQTADNVRSLVSDLGKVMGRLAREGNDEAAGQINDIGIKMFEALK